MLAAAGWGALLGILPGTEFTVPLLGPPVAFLFLLRKRPLLSWQIPIIAASISAALIQWDPHGPYTQGPLWPVIFLLWAVVSLFSVPWPYIFQRATQLDRQKARTLAQTVKMSLGVGFLIFFACGLIILGGAACVYPVPSQGNRPLFDQSLGFLMMTSGTGLAVYISRNAKKLGLNYEVESLFGWILALVALVAVPGTIIDLYQGKVHCVRSDPNCTQLGPPLEVFLNCVASLEALAVVIWLLRRGRRAKRVIQDAEIRSQS